MRRVSLSWPRGIGRGDSGDLFFFFFFHVFFEWVHWPCRKRCQLNCNNRIGSMLDNHGSAKQYVGIAVTIFTPLLVSEFRYDACKAS